MIVDRDNPLADWSREDSRSRADCIIVSGRAASDGAAIFLYDLQLASKSFLICAMLTPSWRATAPGLTPASRAARIPR